MWQQLTSRRVLFPVPILLLWLARNSLAASSLSPEPGGPLRLPFGIGLNPLDYSLPGLAVLLGLLDGLNPCAMWVLAYLISLCLGLDDRRRIWLLVGTFVLASGLLYFLFMAAWLNVFLVLGHLRLLTVLVGLFAIVMGAATLRTAIFQRTAPACRVVSLEKRRKTFGRMQRLVFAPLSLASLAAMVTLAFAVNSIEFVCSAGIPAVFTHVLAQASLPALRYYGYLALYTFFFMLDDLLIFASAALAINSRLGDRYAAYSKPLAGLIMVGLGVLLLFFPDRLR